MKNVNVKLNPLNAKLLVSLLTKITDEQPKWYSKFCREFDYFVSGVNMTDNYFKGNILIALKEALKDMEK